MLFLWVSLEPWALLCAGVTGPDGAAALGSRFQLDRAKLTALSPGGLCGAKTSQCHASWDFSEGAGNLQASYLTASVSNKL